jgi:hypothetical protein
VARSRRVTRRDEAGRVVALLGQLGAVRAAASSPRLPELQAWQRERLARTFADLGCIPRYRAATAFFLDELYGEHDVSWRDRDVARMLPTLRRWLPGSMLHTLADALDLDLLTSRLDSAMARALDARLPAGAELDAVAYAEAYREATSARDRQRQIELLLEVGADLDAIVRKPLVFAILRLARAPAHAAGLGALQAFLERGFAAFRAIGGADRFLATIGAREREISRRLYAGHGQPFAVGSEVP